MKNNVSKRFWSKVQQSQEDACWRWLGSHPNSGGQFWLNGGLISASKYAYEETYGTIEEDFRLYHLCDHTYCVNPRHLCAAGESEGRLRKAKYRGDLMRTEKECSKCSCKKQLEEFPLRKAMFDGADSWCKKCHLIFDRDKRNANRRGVLDAYGSQCACCGEDEIAFLVFDHVYGGGTKHIKSLGGGGVKLRKWIKDNNYPDVIQVLCANCNQSKGAGQCCIHQAEQLAEALLAA